MNRKPYLTPFAIAAICFLSVHAQGAMLVFSTDFNTSVPAQFSGITATASLPGYNGLGPAGNQFSGNLIWNNANGNPATATVLTLTNLPAHVSLDISFLAALLNTWDGNNPTFGPDRFNVSVDGVLVFSQIISNFGAAQQPYVPPAGVLLTPRPLTNLEPGGNTGADSAYNFGLEPSFVGIPHTASTAVISWFGSGIRYRSTGVNDESFAIDNVRV